MAQQILRSRWIGLLRIVTIGACVLIVGCEGGTVDTDVIVGPTDGPWVQISAGQRHTCALFSDNAVHCWGDDGNGQLGNGSAGEQTTLGVAVSGLVAKQITTDKNYGIFTSNYTCALSANDNSVSCWGSDNLGQLGNGATAGNQQTPVAVDLDGASIFGNGSAKQVFAGGAHACAILNDSSVKCWGVARNQQLLNGSSTSNQTAPAVAIDLVAKQLALGSNHSCAIFTDDGVRCWGSGRNGRLGIGNTALQSTPTPVDLNGTTVDGNGTAKQIDVGSFSSCAILSDDSVSCWGSDGQGQQGNGDAKTGNQLTPMPVDLNSATVDGNGTAKQIALGGSHACVILSDDTVRCWGGGVLGQLGNGAEDNQTSPAAVDLNGSATGLGEAADISTGTAHTCVIISGRRMAKCWGAGDDGQLGDGQKSNRSSPVEVRFSASSR